MTTRPNFKRNTIAFIVSQALLGGIAGAATITVNNNGDAGAGCTLREAVGAIDAGAEQNGCTNSGAAFGTDDTIIFAASLNNQTITLAGTQISLANDLTIDGPGAGLLSISGDNNSRIFSIEDSSDVTIQNLTIADGEDNDGGAILVNDGSTLTLNNSTITSSYASCCDGGGIAFSSAEGEINNSTITGNKAEGEGGGIALIGRSTVTINDSVVSNNTAVNYGGGMYISNYSAITINGTTISGNSADDDGGGIALYQANDRYGNATIINSTISGNISGDDGGGIENEGNLYIFNSTIVNNDADFGDGIQQGGNGVLELFNTILANNLGDDCQVEGGSNAVTDNGGNLVENDAAGDEACGTFDIEGQDPNLGALADNGGPPTSTGAPPFTHALLEGSVAIDAGEDCAGPPVDGLDQRDVTRDADCDIGAYEAEQEETFAVPTLSAWALFVTGGLLALFGGAMRRRQRQRET